MAEKRSRREIENELENHSRWVKFMLPEYEKLKGRLESITDEIDGRRKQIKLLETELKTLQEDE